MLYIYIYMRKKYIVLLKKYNKVYFCRIFSFPFFLLLLSFLIHYLGRQGFLLCYRNTWPCNQWYCMLQSKWHYFAGKSRNGDRAQIYRDLQMMAISRFQGNSRVADPTLRKKQNTDQTKIPGFGPTRILTLV